MAYFIQLAMYLLFFKVTKLKALAPIAIGVIFISYFALNSQYGDEIRDLTVGRFEKAAQGKTNRTDISESAYSFFKKSPIIGMGAKNFEKEEYMSDNPYEIPAKDGILGTFFTYLPLLLIFLRCKNSKVRYAVLILAVGYLQRPFHINLMHYLMLFTLFYACEKYYRISSANSKKKLMTNTHPVEKPGLDLYTI